MAIATQELERFVRDALAAGQARPDVESVLATAGWPREQVQAALVAYADIAFPIPVPRPRPYLSPREAFLYLVLFAALYTWAFHVGSLLFDLIARAFPDPADSSYMATRLADSLRFSTAAVVIAFPVFLFVARRLGNTLVRNPVKRLSAVRRWLTYLTLFVAACILVGDMIALVYGLLGGELTLRFVLKVLVVATIAGGIFGWYLLDLRGEEQEA